MLLILLSCVNKFVNVCINLNLGLLGCSMPLYFWNGLVLDASNQSRLQVEYRLKIIDPCLWISLALGWSYFTGKFE
jgi:hypothetical protein